MTKSARQRLLEYSAGVLFATLVAGCGGTLDGGTSATSDAGHGPLTGSASHPAPAESAGALRLRGVDYEGLLAFLESHKGHPIVLDIWSTSCDPCIRELPNLARLQEDYSDRGVVCASFNIDYTGAEGTTPDEAKERAREVLEALDVRVQNLYGTISDRDLYRTELFKENQVYAIPAILVFDKSGRVIAKFGDSAQGASPYEQVRSAIDRLL
jgi:thiol-disulfide isomerase/thioredoxin